MIAFQFPGQGSQYIGMGRDLARAFPVARTAFEEADDVLGFGLSRLCWDGQLEELTRTENAQPALLAHSIAASRVLMNKGFAPAAAAGHSLGEFSAHVAAGSLDFADGLRLVRARGKAMAEAGHARAGGMAAILGLDEDEVGALCEAASGDGEVLSPANFNSPGQIVISGSEAAVHRAIEMAASHGARRAIRLTVSGAFHSSLMEPAVGVLAAAMDEVALRPAAIPVVANLDAAPVQEPDEIRDRLLGQLTGPVRWDACVRTLAGLGSREFFEPGPGRVLTGLLRRIDPELTGRPAGEPAEIQEIAA